MRLFPLSPKGKQPPLTRRTPHDPVPPGPHGGTLPMGWEIVRHSFSMLFRNLGSALRISLGPIAVAILVSVTFIGVLQVSAAQLVWELSEGTLTPAVSFTILLLALVYVFVSAWIAVSWHRFILLEEYPGLLPALSGRPVLPYVGKTFLLGFVMILAIIPAMLIVGLLTNIFGILSILGIGLALYVSYIWLRIGLVLPATAVGHAMGIAEAWRATAPHANAILGTSALLILLNTGASIMSGILPATLSLILDIVASWITLMIGTSVLTTLYGVIVERRSLG
jgi:hypothetical protein